MSVAAQDVGALKTAINPAYELVKEKGGQSGYESEVVSVSPETDLHTTKAEGEPYLTPVPPPTHHPLSAIPPLVAPPTGEDSGVAREEKAEVMYESISGDQ